MSSQVTIRALRSDDLVECQASFPEPTSVSYQQQISRQSPDGYSLYGLFVDDELAAMMHVNRHGAKDPTIQRDYPYPILGNLYVLERFRQQGLGRKLLDHVEVALKDEGHQTIGLIVSCQNSRAIHIYEKAGFQPIQQLPPRPDRNKCARLYYTKTLLP